MFKESSLMFDSNSVWWHSTNVKKCWVWTFFTPNFPYRVLKNQQAGGKLRWLFNGLCISMTTSTSRAPLSLYAMLELFLNDKRKKGKKTIYSKILIAMRGTFFHFIRSLIFLCRCWPSNHTEATCWTNLCSFDWSSVEHPLLGSALLCLSILTKL